MDKYDYEEGCTYELIERLEAKFCGQMGIAEVVDSADEVLPNPAAELYNEDGGVAGAPEPVKAAKPAPEPEPEVEEVETLVNEDDPTPPAYELESKGGPWFNVVDVLTGESVNDRALKKADAEELLNELNSDTGSTEE